MGPASIADILQRYGATGVSALCIAAMVAMFWRLSTVQAQLVAELKQAQERETAALRAVLPVVEKLLLAISVLEAKNRRRAADPVAR